MPPRNKPLTTKEVIAKIAQLSGVILLSTYEASNKKVRCKCRRCRYEWTPVWSNLMRSKGCPQCLRLRKGITEISAELARLHPTLKLLSKKYTGVYDHLKLECILCGHKWSRSWHKLKAGKGCPRCQSDKQRLTLAEVKRRLSVLSPGVMLLSDKYNNVKTPLKFRCDRCGSTWVSSWGCLRQGHGCAKCGAANSKLEQRVRSVVEELTGHKFPRCRPAFTKGHGRQPLEIDCYNADLKLGIEPNGPHHYQLCHHNRWNQKKLLAQKRRDWRKRYQCWYHGVKLISVPYWIRNVRSYLSRRIPPALQVSAS